MPYETRFIADILLCIIFLLFVGFDIFVDSDLAEIPFFCLELLLVDLAARIALA